MNRNIEHESPDSPRVPQKASDGGQAAPANGERKTPPPEGHDRAYHLKTADGNPDFHIPLIKSLLARPDVTLHEALVYGLLLDKLGPGHTYCHPTLGEVKDTLKIGLRSAERTMAKLKAKGLVKTVFAGDRNLYYLPNRHVALAKLDEEAPPHRRSSDEQQPRHTGGAHAQGPPHRRGSSASPATVADITNKEHGANQEEDGNEEGAGFAGRLARDPALSFSENDRSGVCQETLESGVGTGTSSSSPGMASSQSCVRPGEPTGPKAPVAHQAASPAHAVSAIESAMGDGSAITVDDLVDHDGQSASAQPESASVQPDSAESVNSAMAASGQCRRDAVAAPGQDALVSSPVLSSAPKAYAIFKGEYLGAQGSAYVGNKGRDLKLLKHILASGTVTESQFRCAVHGMFEDEYAVGRGAGVPILAKDWNEWLVKGECLAAYPPGRQIVVPRVSGFMPRQTSQSDSTFNTDIPPEHLGADWDVLPEELSGTITEAISNPEVRSLLLHGRPGTGKSTTAAATIIGLRDMATGEGVEAYRVRRQARFISQAEFTQHALDTTYLSKDEGRFGEASWNGATEGSRYVNDAMQFPGILVLDDVVHKQAPAKLAPLVIQILNHRHGNNLMTIVTSNLSPAQIAQKLDPAVASRLCGGVVLHFVGEDLRRPSGKERQE